jgi:prolyl oligopeptidase
LAIDCIGTAFKTLGATLRRISTALVATLASLAVGHAVAQTTPALTYPAAMRDDTIDHLFGTAIPAPYRWMEDATNPALAQWVDAENQLTRRYLDALPLHAWFQTNLKSLWNYEKFNAPRRVAGKLFFQRNNGLENQSPIYMQDELGTAPKMVLDPNALSPDGSVALGEFVPSPDGRWLGYALSAGGSDWYEYHVRDLKTGQDLKDVVRWAKFSDISWTNDGKGFFYSRYPTPAEGKALTAAVRDQKLYYHVIGHDQSEDRLVYERPDKPEWFIGASVSEDGHYLYIQMSNGAASNNDFYYANLGDPAHTRIDPPIVPLFTKNDAEYMQLGNIGSTLFMQTTAGAPKRRIVSFDLAHPDAAHWKTVVPESKQVIDEALLAGGKVVVQYLVDAKSALGVFDPDGRRLPTPQTPGIGSIDGLSGRNDMPELFYGFASFLQPNTIYHVDLTSGKTDTFAQPKIAFDASKYVTRQVFYRSKDGTRVPMFITMRKDLPLDGRNPTVLYSYGGFKDPVTPYYSPSVTAWLELGGIYAVANLRGGGEYGEAWHQAGMLANKQNVFDDFMAAADYLEKSHYTSPQRLSVQGYSNGGLLVGATITQHPAGMGAAYAGAGVMDMLRFDRFSGGALWVPEYGSPQNPLAFKWLRAYSPLQNIKDGTCYAATIVTTSDHDDRVVPSHSYQFVAALQHAQSCANPVLIDVATQTSHGYMPTDKRIAQAADVWSFLGHNLGVTAPSGMLNAATGDTAQAAVIK